VTYRTSVFTRDRSRPLTPALVVQTVAAASLGARKEYLPAQLFRALQPTEGQMS